MSNRVTHKYAFSKEEVSLLIQGTHLIVKTEGINVNRVIFSIVDKLKAPFNKKPKSEVLNGDKKS
jgi:hypothetical protein